jgi:hypothetical protein
MEQEGPGFVDVINSFAFDDADSICIVCGLRGHDTNLTGNTPESAMAACVKKLRAMVIDLSKKRGHVSDER